MPFRAGGTETGAGKGTLRVEPDQVLQLRAELQPLHDEFEEFLNRRAPTMAMQPLGADAVSSETAKAFNENAQSAIDAAWGYLGELKNILGALEQAVQTYNLVEDANTQAFRQGTR